MSESHSAVSDSLWLHRLYSHKESDYTVHGILHARILEWLAFLFSRGSSQPRDQTQVSHIAGRFFTSWATRKAQIQMFSVILFIIAKIVTKKRAHLSTPIEANSTALAFEKRKSFIARLTKKEKGRRLSIWHRVRYF